LQAEHRGDYACTSKFITCYVTLDKQGRDDGRQLRSSGLPGSAEERAEALQAQQAHSLLGCGCPLTLHQNDEVIRVPCESVPARLQFFIEVIQH
jgi:hypothetical protein